MDMVVVADMVFTDTARYADIVLPAADYFEYEDIVAGGPVYHVQFSEKAIEPLYESKSDQDIIRLLADKMGVGENFTKSDEEYLAEIITSPFSEQLGITLANLKDKKAIRYMPDPYIDCEGAKFLTATGRMEFYVENPFPLAASNEILDVDRERLPHFFPPTEAWPDAPLHAKYPLVLLSERPRFRVHSQWFATPWLRELDPEPFVKININDAAARNIKTGDYVEVLNDRGYAVVKAVLTQGVRPGAMVFAKGWQAKQYKAGDLSQLASSHFDPFAVNSSFMDEAVEVRKWNGEV
jgi:anaerobic selenocysteine-containing dehydrogenase